MEDINPFVGRLLFVIDDDPDATKYLAGILEHQGYRVLSSNTSADTLQLLQMHKPDLLLLDINMPGLSGFEILNYLRQQEEYVSVIFVSGNSSQQHVVQGLNAGADDYIRKPYDPQELLSRIRAKLRIKDLHDKLTIANHQLKELVDRDDLTGLFNMRSFYDKLENELQRGSRYHRQVGVVMMDMDYFKLANDKQDHLFGSSVLAEVGKIIKHSIRKVDFAARYGGDEFIIVLTETTEHGAEMFTERLRDTIASHDFVYGSNVVHLTCSLGYALSGPGQTIDARTLTLHADKCLYEAKESGRNCVRSINFKDVPNFEKKIRPQIFRKAQ